MKASVLVGRAGKGCDTRNYVGNLKMSATIPERDPFILAAIARALFSDEAELLKQAILSEARRCSDDHNEMMRRSK